MPNTNTEQPINGEDSPAVLAYRVGQLEKSSREGFQKLSDKLDVMSCTFATHKDVEAAQNEAKLEHKAIYEEIDDIKDDIDKIKTQKWLQNTLSAIFGAVISLLIAYTLHSALGF